MKKTLLITGAYGLVGSTICKILERDYPEIEVIKVKCDEFVEGMRYGYFDFVINAAGYGQPVKFTEDKIKTISINTNLVPVLFSMLKKNGKFLFISTSEVYSGAPSPHTEDMIGTTTPQHPRACYIEGKRCGEAICMAYKEQGYDVKIARLALAYGPGTKKGDTRVINQFIEQALTTGEIRMKDEGDAVRTYIYAEDAARIMLDILFKGQDVVYNVGGFSRISILELAVKIASLTNSKVIQGYNSLEGAPDDVSLDMTNTIIEFGGEFNPFEIGLPETIEYQKQLYGIKN